MLRPLSPIWSGFGLSARHLLVLFAVSVACVAAPLGHAQSSSDGTLRGSSDAPPASGGTGSADALKRFGQAIVRIDTRVAEDATSADALGARRVGSGVILEPRLVLTIGYLLMEAEQVDVTTASGRRVPGSVAGYDHATGFGLVRTALPMDGQPMELGDSDRVRERQKLLTQGHGESQATELLVISRKTFTGSWEYLLERPIYTFPPVNNWSGSALIDADGRLVGIGSLIVNDASTDRPGVPGNLFVPVNLLKPILRDLVEHGRRAAPVQPWIGLTTEQVRGNLMVVRVSREGPAESAGLVAGDIVVAVGGQKVSGQADFYRRLWQQGPAGTEVRLRVLREGELRELAVKSVDRMDALRKPRGI